MTAPPMIIPGITRLFLIHKKAVLDKYPGIFGYCYLSSIIYTRNPEIQTPKWIRDLSDSEIVQIVNIGEHTKVEGKKANVTTLF
jgi:hypothetical protein